MPDAEKAYWGDSVEDDVSNLTLDDSEGQRLWIRVGLVFAAEGADNVPGIWIEYQEKSLNSPMQGPLLVSPSSWEKIKQHIDARLKGFNKSNYRLEGYEDDR